MGFGATLVVGPSKPELPAHLNSAIVDVCHEALKERGIFTIALSGGSLPGFLGSMQESFDAKGIDPKFEAWHVILADERCVKSDDPDSNLGSLQSKFFSKVKIPTSQIYGINEDKLESTEAVAVDYEAVVKKVLGLSGGQLDLAVLGFGPDGHTCSLFPNHALLEEKTKWVAPIEDSPKPPPKRITLTYPVLNTMTRHVIFCGAGSSKGPILQGVFETVNKSEQACSVEGGSLYTVSIKEPAPYPSAGVLPNSEGTDNTLTWIVDQDAMAGVDIK